MEGNWEPFEVVEDDEGTTLQLHGTAEERKIVKEEDTPKILEAIKNGWDISIWYANIQGYVDIRGIDLESNQDGKLVIKGGMYFSEASFTQYAYFKKASFTKEAYFGGASFTKDVDFSRASFTEDADFYVTSFTQNADFSGANFTKYASFSGASFTQNAYFSRASFGAKAEFSGVKMKYPAHFARVRIHENTVQGGLRNDILCPAVKLLTMGKLELKKKLVTDIYSINTAVVMNTSTSPCFKRYIDDEQWISDWRRSGGKGKKALFIIWELTSHCGRSVGLWAFWSLLLTFVFALAYTPAPDWMGDSWCGFWQEHGATFEQQVSTYEGLPMSFRTSFYFSIVNFTTLGFGDIVAANSAARFLVGLEVVLGYVMLGGLISIFANKFARRS